MQQRIKKRADKGKEAGNMELEKLALGEKKEYPEWDIKDLTLMSPGPTQVHFRDEPVRHLLPETECGH